MSNGKKIGNNYERDFAYQLSEWLTGKKNSDVCWRDTGSGSRFSTRKKQNKSTSQSGDIIPTDLKYKPLFDVCYFDTKSYKSINFLFINNANQKSNTIFQQWIKTVNDCPKNKYPIMVVKIRNRQTPEFIIAPASKFCFHKDNSMQYHFCNRDGYDCIIVLLSDFFKLNNWVDIVEKNKKNLLTIYKEYL